MITCLCVAVCRDKNKPTVYTLRDGNGATLNIDANHLKMQIKSGQLNVTNLTLSKDDRIIPHRELCNTGKPNNIVPVDKATFDTWWKNMLQNIQKEFGGKLKVEDKSIHKGEYCKLFYYIEGIPYQQYRYSIWFIISRKTVIKTNEKFLKVDLMVLDDAQDEVDGLIKYSTKNLPLPLFTKNNMISIEKAVNNLIKGHREKVEKFFKNY